VRRAIALIAAVAPAGLIVLGASQVASGTWIHAKAALAQVLLEHAWQQTIDGDARVRPWPWADTWPVARLRLPRLDASLIVLSGASGRTLAFGPGHTQGSSLPGEMGTSIVSGHRDTHFEVLREVRRGDEVVVERTGGELVRYRVEGLDVVDSRTTGLGADEDGRALVLVTCWPFDALRPGGPWRYVVTARAEDLPEGRAAVQRSI
jgi:sortase A